MFSGFWRCRFKDGARRPKSTALLLSKQPILGKIGDS
jgi:hypothetical protein